MKNKYGLILVAVILLLGTVAWGGEGRPARYVLDFEGMAGMPDAWVAKGEVSIDKEVGFNSAQSLLVTRTSAAVTDVTSAVLPSFPVCEGIWELKMFYQSDLYSPDSSFNGTVVIDFFDKAGRKLSDKELLTITGKKKWTEERRQVTAPEEAIQASLRVVMNKTYGSFRLDSIGASFLAPAHKTIFNAIKLAPRTYSGFFLPENNVIFDLTVECREKWQAKDKLIRVVVTDYWGAEQVKEQAIALTLDDKKKGSLLYKGTLELNYKELDEGKYYELRTRVENGTQDSYMENSSFSIQPKPVTKKYRPHEIPFTLNNWDDRIKDTFFLADRLGIRWKLVWSGWERTPPYKPYAPGIEWIKQLDMGALLAMGPVSAVEHGDQTWTAEAIREGAKAMVNTYKDVVPIMIRCGNEPHGGAKQVKEDVAAYKAAYEGAKAADPDVFFIGTSCGPNEEFFKQGFQDYLDAVDFHTYSGWKDLREIRKEYDTLFAKYNFKKPIYCTEIGLNSQGMAREDVVRDMIKKFAVFFAVGGQNLAWFDLTYPDPKGTRTGTVRESFDVFNAKYSLFVPKITAVSYYNMVNGICIKKFVEEKVYDGEIEAILFRDRDNRCLLVTWKEEGRKDAFLPLPGVNAVKLIRIDGSMNELDAGGKGLNLTFSEDPLLLFFDSADLKLAQTLDKPSVSLKGMIPTIVKGSSATLSFLLNGVDASGYSLRMPMGWKAERLKSAQANNMRFQVTAPERTLATLGQITLQRKDKAGELSLPLPVAGKIGLRVVPLPYRDGKAGVQVTIKNNGESAETVHYAVDVPEEIPMEKGTFQQSHAQYFTPIFEGKSTGKVVLNGHSETTIMLSTANFDPKCIYRVRVSATDSANESVLAERYLSGFVGVPKVQAPLTLNPIKDAAAWQKAMPLMINEKKQYYLLNPKPVVNGWDGPADLSGELRLLWDDQYLYLRADITDDRYVHAKKDGMLWAMDGLQVLVDPTRELRVKSGYYDISMGQGAEGDQAWCHSSAHPSVLAGAAKGIIVKTFPSEKSPKGRIQIVAIPWKNLVPFTPAPGANLGIAVIINEDDGPGRGSFMGWFGCVHSKQMDLVGDLVLQQ